MCQGTLEKMIKTAEERIMTILQRFMLVNHETVFV